MPKGLLKVNERPIIEESITNLVGAGIERILMVTGHLAEKYEYLHKMFPGLIHPIHNVSYALSGSMHSLSLAATYIDETFLLLEADLVYEKRAVIECLHHPGANVIILGGTTGHEGGLIVESRQGKLHKMTKASGLTKVQGASEFIGISKLSRHLFQAMLTIAAVASPAVILENYEIDYLAAAALTSPIDCRLLPDLRWVNINSADDLAWAQRLFQDGSFH